MKNIVKISVIIPTYNRCSSLKYSVESVINQNFFEWELIIIDDASTDATSKYCIDLQKKNAKIRYIRQSENRGGCAARNAGINVSTGKFCAFLDDDDRWHSQKLKRQFDLIVEDECGICYTAKNLVNNNKHRRNHKYSHHVPRYPMDFHRSIMHDNFIGSTSTVLIKKELLDGIGGFDEMLPALQDWDVYIRLLQKGATVCRIEDSLIDYFILDETRSISCSRENFNLAARHIINKYQCDPYIKSLKHILRVIAFKRLFKSKHYLAHALKFFG